MSPGNWEIGDPLKNYSFTGAYHETFIDMFLFYKTLNKYSQSLKNTHSILRRLEGIFIKENVDFENLTSEVLLIMFDQGVCSETRICERLMGSALWKEGEAGSRTR